jgi:5-methylcytosine-specific restriction endonuclease McrA
VEQWIGKTDDSAIPPRVKDRVVTRCGGTCQECRTPFSERVKPEFDHIVSLINGGAHAEVNLQPLCKPCHAAKTKVDVAEKSAVYRSRAKSLGYFAPKQKIQSPGFRPRPPQRSASRPINRTSAGGDT